jgi:hypothetical protein
MEHSDLRLKGLRIRVRRVKARDLQPEMDVPPEIRDQMNRAEPFFAKWYEESVSSWHESEASNKGTPPPVPLARVNSAFILDGTVYFPSGYDRKKAARRYISGEFGSLDGAFFFVNVLGGKTHLHLRSFHWDELVRLLAEPPRQGHEEQSAPRLGRGAES